MTSTDTRKVIPLPDGRRIVAIRVHIHQPKLRAEAITRELSVEQIMALAARYRSGAASVANAVKHYKVISIADWNRTYLNPNPNDEECAFCRAMAECPNAAEKVRQTIIPMGAIEDLDDVPEKTDSEKPAVSAARREIVNRLVPEDMEHLDLAMQKAPFVEDWIAAVRARMEQRLLAGEKAEHFGLDTGRMGARKFIDPEAATVLLRKKYRLKEKDVFNFKLKTPTQLEELTKPVKDPQTGEIIKDPLIGDQRWLAVCKLVDQRPPKPTVKRKDLIKKPHIVEPLKPLDAIADEDDDPELY